jgi:hypothetical protein
MFSLIRRRARAPDPAEAVMEEAREVGQLLAEGCRSLAEGDAAGALAKFDRALAWNPFHAPALEGMAEAHHRLGVPGEAAYCRRRAMILRGEAWRYT